MRHRNLEVFSGYVYDLPTVAPYPLPIKKDGKWVYDDCIGRTLDRARFEDLKTRYYELEGWDKTTGWPTRKTLSELGMDYVADELQQSKKLGS